MKGLAAEWYNDVKTTITTNFVAGQNGHNNFEECFKARFVTEQRQNNWFNELMSLKQKPNQNVDAYAAKL